MKVLISSTYFFPYSSGLSVYALRLAEGLAERGHEVVVLTSQFKGELEKLEAHGKFNIVRVPVVTRLSKGVLMPALIKTARKWIEWADIVNLHLPQFESLLLSHLARRSNKPVLVTYHCDLVLSGGGMVDRLAVKVTTEFGKQVLKDANLIVQNSLDYAENSPILSQFLEKVVEVPTPVKVKTVSNDRVEAFRQKFGIRKDDKVIGLAGRVASVDAGGAYFVLSDGSGVQDPNGRPGVRVRAAGIMPPGLAGGDFVTVTGISSCYQSGEDLCPQLLVRTAADIHVVSP